MKKIDSRFQEYLELKKGLKAKPKKSHLIGKSILAIGLPVLSLGTINAQCTITSMFLVSQIVPEGIDGPDAGKDPEAGAVLSVDIDGGGPDLQFYERRSWVYDYSDATQPGLGPLKVRVIGTLKLLRTTTYASYPDTNASVKNFANNAAIPGVNPTFTYGYIDANAGYGQWQANEPPTGPGGTVTGNMGILKTNYGFLTLTVTHEIGPSRYRISITNGGFAVTSGTNVVMAGDCSSLPVELVNFTASPEGRTVHLKWETATETNNAGFEVQRSTDGTNFKSLRFVEGNGSSLTNQKYEFSDEGLRRGQQYFYRLKQLDYDGRFEYSEVVSATIASGSSKPVFSPNPSGTGRMNLAYTSAEEGVLDITFFDVSGRAIHQLDRSMTQGVNKMELDLSEMHSGMYFVKVQHGEIVHYEKVILE